MPSIVPWGPSQDVFLVLDQFGERLGRAWRETDENDTDYETLIRHLLEGQCNNPVRVVAFNTDEGWSRDVSDDVAEELRERCAQRGEAEHFGFQTSCSSKTPTLAQPEGNKVFA